MNAATESNGAKSQSAKQIPITLSKRDNDKLVQSTADIVNSYVGKNAVSVKQLPKLIEKTYAALSALATSPAPSIPTTSRKSVGERNYKTPSSIESIKKQDFKEFLKELPKGSVDLILTDPPYTISKDTGFASIGKNSVERFAVSMDFGEWDKEQINLDDLTRLSYDALRKGGTIIVFYDLWKITNLAEAMTNAGFKQLRLIEWKKTNPVPLNSKNNYLTNSREIALLAVKGGKPTFHSEYDTGTYHHPIPNNGKRYHPTQKPLLLMEELITIHSNPNDLVVDPFVGSGTTAVAAKLHNRKFAGCDIDENYVSIARRRVENNE